MTQPFISDYERPLVWAIHFGYDNNGRSNLEGIKRVIVDNQANIIGLFFLLLTEGLVETDGTRTVMGNRDVVEWLAENLHMNSGKLLVFFLPMKLRFWSFYGSEHMGLCFAYHFSYSSSRTVIYFSSLLSV